MRSVQNPWLTFHEILLGSYNPHLGSKILYIKQPTRVLNTAHMQTQPQYHHPSKKNFAKLEPFFPLST